MKASLKSQILKLLNKSEDKTLIWHNGQYFELIKGEMKTIIETTAKQLMGNPELRILAFRINQKKFDFDTSEWKGPELQPLPEQLRDRKNTLSLDVDSMQSVEAIIKLRKEFAK